MSLHRLVKELHSKTLDGFGINREEMEKGLSRERESVESRKPIEHKSTLVDSANLISISSLRILRQLFSGMKSDDEESNGMVDDAIKLLAHWISNFKESPYDHIQNWYTGNAGSIMDQLSISKFGDDSRDKRTFQVPRNIKEMVYAFDLFLERMGTKFDQFSARQFNSDIRKHEVINIFREYLYSLKRAEVVGMDTIIENAEKIVMNDVDKESEGGGVADTSGSAINKHINKKANYMKMANVESRAIANIVERKLAELEAKSDTRGVDVLGRALDSLSDAADYELKVIKQNSRPGNEVRSGKEKDKVKNKIDDASSALKSID